MQLQVPRFRQGERGSAMVEFSIMMIVLIPMLTYGFYLTDVGHHMLDVQETVISTTWDYTSRTNEGMTSTSQSATNMDNVYKADRFEYADHTSAYDDYADPNDSANKAHYHYEVGSKAAWVAGVDLPPGKGQDLGRGGVDYDNYATDYKSTDSRQVTCAIDSTADLDVFNAGVSLGAAAALNPAYSFGKSKFARGGVVTCWAKLNVYNYVVPEKFLNGEHAHEDMTQSQFIGDRSTDVEGLTSAAKPLVLRDHAAVSFGTWALNSGGSSIGNSDEDIAYCPDSANPFYAREVWFFSGGLSDSTVNALTALYGYSSAETLAFVGQASSVEIVNPVPVTPAGGNNASPVPAVGCVLQGNASALAGLPASPLTAELVARHDKTDSSLDGVNQDSPTSWDLGAKTGPNYESSPMKNGNSDFQTAYQNRGMYYMGASSDKG